MVTSERKLWILRVEGELEEEEEEEEALEGGVEEEAGVGVGEEEVGVGVGRVAVVVEAEGGGLKVEEGLAKIPLKAMP